MMRRGTYSIELFLDFLVAAAIAKVACGLLAYYRTPFPSLQQSFAFLIVSALTLVGLGILAVPRQDPCGRRLGCLYLVIAASFMSSMSASMFSTSVQPFGFLVYAVERLQIEAFLPWLVWLFFWSFPRVDRSRDVDWVWESNTILLLIGVAMFGLNLVGDVSGLPYKAPRALLSSFMRREVGGFSYYWTLILLLCLSGLVLGASRIRFADRDERRRAGMFTVAVVVGWLPIILMVIGEHLRASLRFLPAASKWHVFLAYAFLLSVPMTTAYAVMVRRVIDVKFLLRTAVKYAVTFLALVPALVLSGYLIANHEKPFNELWGGSLMVIVSSFGALAVILFFVLYRRREGIDASFVPEE